MSKGTEKERRRDRGVKREEKTNEAKSRRWRQRGNGWEKERERKTGKYKWGSVKRGRRELGANGK